MLPFLLPLWESDATARAAVEQSVASEVHDLERAAVLVGAEVSVDASTRGPLSTYDVTVGGAYARALDVSPASGASAPDDSVSGDLTLEGGWDLSPWTDLTVDATGYLASELGVRAGDPLAARDPFLSGGRLQYTIGGGPGLGVRLSRRSRLHLAAGYEQEGALAADDPAAVGVDTHAATARGRYRYELTATDTLRPELSYTYTRFYHALLGADLRRGPADVHAGSALLTDAHAFGRTLTGVAGCGVTVASPPPGLAQRAVVSPEARAELSYLGRRYRLDARYAYTYTSLGPRVGYGQEHIATLEIGVLPAGGALLRDLVVTGLGRLTAGSAPVAPVAAAPAGQRETVTPAHGTISTYTAVAGISVEVPLARGVRALGGFDLEYVLGVRDPAPPGGNGGGTFRTIWTIGVGGTLSTDRRNMLRHDAEEEEEPPRAAPVRDDPARAPTPP